MPHPGLLHPETLPLQQSTADLYFLRRRSPQFYLSLCAVPGSWYAQSMFEPDILDCEVKWALGSITMKKTSGGDGIPVELFQILKDDAVKVLHSLCQQIWKTQQ